MKRAELVLGRKRMHAQSRGKIQLRMGTLKDGIKKKWDIYTMEYCSAVGKDEIMPFATAWMHLRISC